MNLLWQLALYDGLKSLLYLKNLRKNEGSSIYLGEPEPIKKDVYYVIVTLDRGKYKVDISRSANENAVRCEECNNYGHALRLSEVAKTMYRITD